jgi:hypothetical protein
MMREVECGVAGVAGRREIEREKTKKEFRAGALSIEMRPIRFVGVGDPVRKI